MNNDNTQDSDEPSSADNGSQSDYVNELQLIIKQMNAVSLHQCNRQYDGSQNQFVTHPLTCGNDSSHGNLFPWFDGKTIRLMCPDCDYTQGNFVNILRNCNFTIILLLLVQNV